MKRENEADKIYIPSYSANGNTGEGNEILVGTNDLAWHKYDVFINFDTENENKSYGTMRIYQDGVSCGEVPMTAQYALLVSMWSAIFPVILVPAF